MPRILSLPSHFLSLLFIRPSLQPLLQYSLSLGILPSLRFLSLPVIPHIILPSSLLSLPRRLISLKNMSGGVGQTYHETTLPDDQEPPQTKPHQTSGKTNSTFLYFRQLNALAVVLIFAASGLIYPLDLAFSLSFFLYTFFLSKAAFPPRKSQTQSSIFTSKTKLLFLYSLLGTLIGLFLPILYILEGIQIGDKQGIQAASPHVFLLASQIFMEEVIERFSLPIKVLIPVAYNSMRILTIIEWLQTEFLKKEAEGFGRRVYVGRGLAMANMVFWSCNLFLFLLPVCLPRAFEKYYTQTENKVKD